MTKAEFISHPRYEEYWLDLKQGTQNMLDKQHYQHAIDYPQMISENEIQYFEEWLKATAE